MDYKRTSIFTIPEALSKTEVALTKKQHSPCHSEENSETKYYSCFNMKRQPENLLTIFRKSKEVISIFCLQDTVTYIKTANVGLNITEDFVTERQM